jgi:hypothetical protein
VVLGVGGSSPLFHPSQSLANQALTETNPTSVVVKDEKFDESLRGRAGTDLELLEIIDMWPDLPPDIRRMILHVVRNTPDRRK